MDLQEFAKGLTDQQRADLQAALNADDHLTDDEKQAKAQLEFQRSINRGKPCATIKVVHKESGEEMVINAADFDASKHGKPASVDREAELRGLSADDIRAIAEEYGLEYTKKGETIDAILAHEAQQE